MPSTIRPAPQGLWRLKPISRPWPSLPTSTAVESLSKPRSPGFLASQKKIFGQAGLIAGLDPATPFRPLGSCEEDAIDLTRPSHNPAKVSLAPSAPTAGPQSRSALATLPPSLLQALSSLLTEPPILPPSLHQLLHSFLHPSANPFNFSSQPTVAELMTALRAYLPWVKSGTTSRASSPYGTAWSFGRSYTPRNTGIGYVPRRPLHQSRGTSVASADPSIIASSNTPHALIPFRNAIPSTSATHHVHRTKLRKLKDLRNELEAQRDQIARVYTQAKVRLRDLQVEESVLENTRKKLKAIETKRERTVPVEEALALEKPLMDFDMTSLDDIFAWAGMDQQETDSLFS